MKSFIAVEAAKHKKGVPGRYEFKIYRATNRGLEFLGISSIQYGCTRGEESEVFNWLVDNGHLPKSARSEKKGGYYFIRSYQPNISIQYIIPLNQ